MIDIPSLIALCQIAGSEGNKLLESYKKRLSAPERELLIAAAQQGTFYILSVNEIPGSWVRAGGKDFVYAVSGDPAFAAGYLEAFRNLCERGYIHYESGVLFQLTGTGFKKARELSG